jgi:integrase
VSVKPMFDEAVSAGMVSTPHENGAAALTTPGPTAQEGSAPMQSQRIRHRPVPNQTGIYFSVNARGQKSFEVRHPTTRAYEVVGPRLDQAKARYAELVGSKARGERVAPVGMRFSELLDSWREARQVKPRTADSYDAIIRDRIEPRWGRVKVREIQAHDISIWLRGLRRNDAKAGELADGSKRLVLAILSAILEHGVEVGALGQNPAKQIGRKAKPRQGKLEARILSPIEQDALLASCGNFPWLEPIIETALLAGLRLGEILGLRLRDVDFEAGRLHIRQQLGKDGLIGTPKGGAASIPLHPALRTILANQVTLETGPDDLLFTNQLGGKRQHRDVQRAFDKARRYAGLSDEPRALRFHDLRHTAISRLANAPQANLPWVKDYARHADLATTLGYVHVVEDETRLSAAFAALEGVAA